MSITTILQWGLNLGINDNMPQIQKDSLRRKNREAWQGFLLTTITAIGAVSFLRTPPYALIIVLGFSVVFPLMLIANYFKWFTFSKLSPYLLFTCIIALNASAFGEETDTHLILLILVITSHFTFWYEDNTPILFWVSIGILMGALALLYLTGFSLWDYKTHPNVIGIFWAKRIIHLGLFFSVFVAIWRYMSAYRNLQAANITLAENRKELAELNASLAKERDFAQLQQRELKHRVGNNLQNLNTYLRLMPKNDTRQMTEELEDYIVKLGDSHHFLYLDTLGQHQRYIYQANIKPYIMGLTDKFLQNYPQVQVKYDIMDFDENILDSDNMIALGLVIIELLNNAAKYAFPTVPNPSIFLSFGIAEKGYTFHYEDNGNSPLSNLYREGSQGMDLIRLFMEQLYGDISNYQTTSEGCFFTAVLNPRNKPSNFPHKQ